MRQARAPGSRGTAEGCVRHIIRVSVYSTLLSIIIRQPEFLVPKVEIPLLVPVSELSRGPAAPACFAQQQDKDKIEDEIIAYTAFKFNRIIIIAQRQTKTIRSIP